MTAPVVSPAALRTYDALVAYQGGDEPGGFLLLHLCEASARTRAKPTEILRHDDTGSGWRRALDPVRCPAWLLPWLSQFVGCPSIDGLTGEQQRAAVRDAPGLQRGTVAAFTGAITASLIGARTVVVRERYDPTNPGEDAPYHLTFITRTAETPDVAATTRAALTQKPSGLVLHVVVVDGVSWSEVPDGRAWDEIEDGVTWAGVTAADVT